MDKETVSMIEIKIQKMRSMQENARVAWTRTLNLNPKP